MSAATAKVIFSNLAEHEAALVKALREWPCFEETKSHVYEFRSELNVDASLDEQLVWIFGMLDHERRIIKTMTQAGVPVVCQCRVPKGMLPLRIKAKALAKAHVLGIDFEFRLK